MVFHIPSLFTKTTVSAGKPIEKEEVLFLIFEFTRGLSPFHRKMIEPIR
jgi:hypothetical protein